MVRQMSSIFLFFKYENESTINTKKVIKRVIIINSVDSNPMMSPNHNLGCIRNQNKTMVAKSALMNIAEYAFKMTSLN